MGEGKWTNTWIVSDVVCGDTSGINSDTRAPRDYICII